MRISSFSGSAVGAASTPMAVHDLLDDWTVRVFLDRLTPNKNAVIQIQDSLDGFASDVRTLRTISVAAVTNLTPHEIQPSRRYELPNSKFGVVGATARVFVQQIDAGATIAGRFVVDF